MEHPLLFAYSPLPSTTSSPPHPSALLSCAGLTRAPAVRLLQHPNISANCFAAKQSHPAAPFTCTRVLLAPAIAAQPRPQAAEPTRLLVRQEGITRGQPWGRETTAGSCILLRWPRDHHHTGARRVACRSCLVRCTQTSDLRHTRLRDQQRLTCGSKPMSSMRSASSSTR